MSPPHDCLRCGTPIPAVAPGGECPVCLVRLSLDPEGPAADPTVADVQAALPHLEIQERIGRGGCGVVYRGRQPDLDRLVAVKWLTAERAADPGFVERFVREAKTLARLDHPHIVRVYDIGRAEGSAYLVMEYVPGGSLRDRLHGRRLAPADALRLVPQLCEAVQYAHDRGVVHRDIKPENVLLDAAGRVKVADFGLAKLYEDEAGLTGSGERMGTARYMAPEQWADTATVDHRADIYSLGVLFYELLTGDLPTPQYAPPSRKAGTDRRLDRVVSKSLRDRPSERYQQAAELKSDVDRIAAHPRHLWRWAVLAAAVTALAVGAWLGGGKRPVAQAAGSPATPSTTASPPVIEVTPGSPTDILTSPDYEWTPPENLGPPVNTADDDTSPYPTADGLGLVFRSKRPGGQGDGDLWEARRPAPDAPFGEPVNLGPQVNSEANDDAPCLTADTLLLAFVSDRPGGRGHTDVYLSSRPAADALWGPTENLGPAINSESYEFRPWLAPDGLTLTFSSLRPPQPGLYRCRRASRSEPFGPAEPFAPNAQRLSVGQVAFTADGRTILLNRYDRVFPRDTLWLGRVDNTDRPLLNLVSFGPVVNGFIDTHPAPSADGRTVYFDSDRPGGQGERDVWLTRRVPKTGTPATGR